MTMINKYLKKRKYYGSSSEYGIKDKIYLALKLKPEKHDFIIEKNVKPYMTRYMNVTGG